MDILQRKSEKVLNIRTLIYYAGSLFLLLLASCGGGGTGTQNDTTTIKSETKEAGNVPATEDNFDKFYSGTLGDMPVQMNLRRYGKEVSGSFWYKNTGEEMNVKGTFDEISKTINLTAYNLKKEITGNISGKLDEKKSISGEWKDVNNQNPKPVEFNVSNDNTNLKVKLDDITVNKKSAGNHQTINITYPHLAGISDNVISNKINSIIENHFHSSTMLDSVDLVTFHFNEDVKYEVSYFKGEMISICKNHHLSIDNDTQLFDDSHGININFKRGKVYELRDLFKPNAIDQLNDLILDKINNSCGGKLTQSDLEKCKLAGTEISSFSLTENNKITFHLTERLPRKYRGCGYVRIEITDLKDFVNPSGPLQMILHDIANKNKKQS